MRCSTLPASPTPSRSPSRTTSCSPRANAARELGCTPIGPAGGATLRVLAAATGARSVVEVGTGAGVSGLYLLGGMAADGVLTTIDVEGENQRAAKQAYTEAGIAPARYRLINGSATEVLPRLRDEAYDLVLVDADKTSYGVYFEQALRLLRVGGDRRLRQRALARPGRRPVAARHRDDGAARSRADRPRPRRARLGPARGGRRPAGRRQALDPATAENLSAPAWAAARRRADNSAGLGSCPRAGRALTRRHADNSAG